MAVKPLPSQKVLRQLLEYDQATGRLFWKLRSGPISTADARGAEWAINAVNNRIAGKEAFTYADRRGYKHGKVNGEKYQAHRIIWKLVYGKAPVMIDHINGVVDDNRLENLRDCSNAENCRNYRKPSGATSKFRGVCWVNRDQKWAARIAIGGGKKKSLGNFDDEHEAARAYDRAAKKYHEQFAVLNFTEEEMCHEN